MSAENVGLELIRDTALEQAMLEAVVADRNDQPRNKQLQVGPSEVGGCRELLRAGIFESETLAEPETHWSTAAHVGTVMGADLERIFGRRLDALEQQRVTAMFQRLGVGISGSIDLLFIDRGHVTDLKSVNDMGGVLYDLKRDVAAIDTLLGIWREGLLFEKSIETPDGGYELTAVMVEKLVKLHYYVQVAIYVVGAIQLGILESDAEGRLVFYDRSGSYQEFVAMVIPAEWIAMFYEIGQRRIEQVVQAQEAYEGSGGNPAIIAHLRDKTPSFCFSPKVQCPRRMHCWAGSDWTAANQITDVEHVAAVDRYIVGRDMEKLGKGMKQAARDELKDIQGVLPDGRMVTWTRGGSTINVVETTEAAPTAMTQVLDEALGMMRVDDEPEAAATDRDGRRAQLKKLRVGQLRDLLDKSYNLDTKGKKDELIERILDHELPEQPVEGETATDYHEPVPPVGAYVEPDAQREVLEELAMQGGPEGDEAADVLAPVPASYESGDVLRRRQEIFGWSFEAIQNGARAYGIDHEQPKSHLIQAILDYEFPPQPGRGWSPSGDTTGDPTTDRLRQMQYNSDPAMRRNYQEES